MQVKPFAVSLKLQASVIWDDSETLAILVCKLLCKNSATRKLTLLVRTLLQLFKIVDHVQVLGSLPVVFLNKIVPESVFSFNDILHKIFFVIGAIDCSLVQSELQHLESDVDRAVEDWLPQIVIGSFIKRQTLHCW